MSTPHNGAKIGEIAKTVLMPGDPLRAKFIAENFLSEVKCVSSVRNMLAFTGKYRGKEITAMGSGMGIPSIGIYSQELYDIYGVENIIRVGTAGAVADKVNLLDIVIAQGACTNSSFAKKFALSGDFSAICSFSLLEKSVAAARGRSCDFHVGNILSSDVFYDGDESILKNWGKMGILAVEMEAAGLYMTAAAAGKNALCITTISDCPLKGLSTTADEREKSFTRMMEIALETAIN